MPLRAASRASAALIEPCCLAWTLRGRLFSTSALLRSDFAHKNHYERLGIRHDASPVEIKKSFYSLSKSHHPDVTSSPNAAHNFSLLSESYTVLSDPSRRAQYDCDVLRLHHPHHHTDGHPSPSYYRSANTNPAGGRAPSGLSRRRGTFRGPPPSFYRNGGWGVHGEKRQKAHETSTASSNTADQQHPPWSHHHAAAGMGPGSNPFHHDEHVPHFDREGHTRTHKREDERRWQRREKRAMGDDDVEFEPQTSLAGHFFIVAGILAATMVAPLVYLQVVRLGKRDKDR